MPFLALLQSKTVIIAIVAFLAGAAGAGWTAREIYTGKIAKIELAHNQALLAAVEEARETQSRIDGIATAALEHHIEVKLDIVMQTQRIIREIPRYVQDTSTCVTVGLIRVLDAAALGVDPADLALAPGEFNETCAGIGSHALATSVVGNYGIARENAAQLTGLQGYVGNVATTLNARPGAINGSSR